MRAMTLGIMFACVAMAQVPLTANNLDLVAAARRQVGVTVHYDGSYQPLEYPGGDVPVESGVCTDVIVRALRTARSLDLQKLVHEDMQANLAAYPHPPTRRQPEADANIDHRRVPNQMTWFARAGYSRPLPGPADDYLPGDIVAWNLGGGILHIGMISDMKSGAGTPLVIHNIGAGAAEEDILWRFTIIGHYRLPPRLGPLP
jgi:uncharacterized protein YijF (DUF1287 family)